MKKRYVLIRDELYGKGYVIDAFSFCKEAAREVAYYLLLLLIIKAIVFMVFDGCLWEQQLIKLGYANTDDWLQRVLYPVWFLCYGVRVFLHVVGDVWWRRYAPILPARAAVYVPQEVCEEIRGDIMWDRRNRWIARLLSPWGILILHHLIL